MEADIDSDVDEENCRDGVKAIQLHTGGMCHPRRGDDKAGS